MPNRTRFPVSPVFPLGRAVAMPESGNPTVFPLGLEGGRGGAGEWPLQVLFYQFTWYLPGLRSALTGQDGVVAGISDIQPDAHSYGDVLNGDGNLEFLPVEPYLTGFGLSRTGHFSDVLGVGRRWCFYTILWTEMPGGSWSGTATLLLYHPAATADLPPETGWYSYPSLMEYPHPLAYIWE